MDNWIQITEIDVLDAENGAVVSAAREALLADGQGDPLPGIIDSVVQEVRGRVAAGGYRLAAGSTIPAVLETTAVDLIIYRLTRRLPNLRHKHYQERAEAADKRLLEIAKGLFAIPEPATPDPDFREGENRVRPKLASPNPDRKFGRTQSDGL